MKVEKRHLKQNLFVSSTFINQSHTFRPVRTRNARSALRARHGLKLERRARTYGALPRTQATEGTERKGLDTRNSKILGEFYHQEDRKQEKGGNKGGHTKKNSGHTKKISKRTKLTKTTDDRAHAKVNDATPRAKRVTELRCGQTAC